MRKYVPFALLKSGQQWLTGESVDGSVQIGHVSADIVAERGKFASIYSWSANQSGSTRAALGALRAYGGRVVVHDVGESGTASRSYWEKMREEGLVDELRDGDDQLIPSPVRLRGELQ